MKFLIATLYIPFENSQETFMLTENRVPNNKKLIFFFFFGNLPWNLFSNSFYGMHGCLFLAVRRTVFSQCITVQTSICHHLGERCTAPLPCPGFSPDSAHHALTFGCCEQWVRVQGQAGPLGGKSCCHRGVGHQVSQGWLGQAAGWIWLNCLLIFATPLP